MTRPRRALHASTLVPNQVEALPPIPEEMRTIPVHGEWYALTLTASDSGLHQYGWYSVFVGFTKDRPRRELRGPGLVDPQRMAALWADLGQSFLVVRNRTHLALFIRLGGACLIAGHIAEGALSDWMVPMAVGVEGILLPPKSISLASPEETQHAPTPKLRAATLKRDEYRCLACGRRPANNPDIELNLHHITPFAEGGLTTKTNLITLCHTCHRGLDPHREFKMWELLSATEPVHLPCPEDILREYRAGVARHRQIVDKLTAEPEFRSSSRRGTTMRSRPPEGARPGNRSVGARAVTPTRRSPRS